MKTLCSIIFTACALEVQLTLSVLRDIESGEQVWRVKVNSGSDVSNLEAILVEPFVKLEREKRHQNYTEIFFRVAKKYRGHLRTSLRRHHYVYDIIVYDVLDQLDIESNYDRDHKYDGDKRRRRSIASLEEFDYSIYHNLAEIQQWMNFLAKRYDFVEKIKLGKSYQKRNLYMLKISTNPRNPNRPALFMDAAIHAREWIAPAALMYVCNQILSNSTYSAILSGLDYYVIPVVNLDGYAYTWRGKYSRLWRKTMRLYPKRDGSIRFPCVGVDGNRNWDINFGGEGSSNNRCSLVYHGPRPESEYVVRHVANFLRAQRHKIKGLVTLHSYGQQILYPYNFNKTKAAPTESVLKSVGDNVSDAMVAIHGKRYENGRGSKVLYVFSGSTSDWAYEKASIPLSYTIELRDTGGFRFELPENEIIPTGEELMAGIQVIAEHIIKNYQQSETPSSLDSKA